MAEEMQSHLPKRMSIEYYEAYMHIQKKWLGLPTIIMGILLLVWVMVFFRTFNLIGTGVNEGEFFLTLMPIVFGCGAVLLAYFLLANWLNKTDIFVSDDLMEIKIGPIPWRGNVKLETANIKQIFIQKQVAGSEKKRKVTYAVLINNQNGKVVKLVGGLEGQDQALFIEQRIENYLGMD